MHTEIIYNLNLLRKKCPLIVNVTNHVTMDFIANGLLAIGASPIMTEGKEEILDLVKIAEAVVINIGTLNTEFIQLCEFAAMTANKYNKLLVLDPVGAGATDYRTIIARNLIKNYQFNVIKGNASEILSLIDNVKNLKGVDSTQDTENTVQAAQALAANTKSVIAISGKTDAVITEDDIKYSNRGSAMLAKITGAGCLLTSVVAAFSCQSDNVKQSVFNAMEYYNICAEVAAQKSLGPGSFKVNFLDELAALKS